MPLPTLTPPPQAPSRSDTPGTFRVLADAFIAWFQTHVAEQNAYTAALPAQITGTDFSGNSTSSVEIGTGAKSLTASTGKQWQIGQPIRIARTSDPTNYMDGQVTAYNSTSGAMTVQVSGVGGSGTYTDWTIALLPSGSGFATINGTETFTNKTLTAPVIATMVSGGQTLTVPATTTTLVGRTTTDTLTNKTIDFAVGGNVGKINGNTLAAGAGTGTITFFNSSDTVVGRNTTDTLTNKTLTSPTINGGALNAASTVSDTGTIATTSVGFRGIPASSNATGTLALTDNGKHIATASSITIPANSSVAFPIGASIEIVNTSASPITISITTDTLRWSGTASTGSRTLAAYGTAVVRKRGSSTTWWVSGDITA